jgi:hypothetical protein
LTRKSLAAPNESVWEEGLLKGKVLFMS